MLLWRVIAGKIGQRIPKQQRTVVAFRCMGEQMFGIRVNPGREFQPHTVRRALRVGCCTLAGFELSQTLHCLSFRSQPRLADVTILQMYPGNRIDLVIRRIFLYRMVISGGARRSGGTEKLFDLAAI